jgi:hypothetical protein
MQASSPQVYLKILLARLRRLRTRVMARWWIRRTRVMARMLDGDEMVDQHLDHTDQVRAALEFQ